jgi:hypothetical protein
MWWLDPHRGIARVRARTRRTAYFIGLNNGFLMKALLALRSYEVLTDEVWRQLHEDENVAPGYIFDSARRDCWAIVVRPGESGDVKFEEVTEELTNGTHD